MVKIQKFEVNPFGENTYIVWNATTGDGIIVDPGMTDPSEFDAIDRFVTEHDIRVRQIVNTHMHLDHIFGANAVKKRYGAELAAGSADARLGEDMKGQIARFHLPFDAAPVFIDRPLADGDVITLGNDRINVITVPGHSPGGIALYSPSGRFVITGDSLFRGSIGRTDLPGGDHAALVGSIHDKLMTLPDDTTVYPGHGPATTIATERIYNPFI